MRRAPLEAAEEVALEVVVEAVVVAVVAEAVVGEVEVASEGPEAGASEVAAVVVVSEGEDIKCNI